MPQNERQWGGIDRTRLEPSLNPTEYLEEAALAALIRHPASVRTWPGMVMRGFSETAIPDAERSDLIAYLST